MTSAIVDTLFPPTPDYLGYALFFGVVIDMFKPIPWLRVIAGLTAMSFEGRYSRSGDEIRIVVCFKTHATEQYDRDGKLIQDSEPPKTGLHLHRLYSAKDLAECADPRVPIMNQIRQVAEHEILESLQVIDGSGSRQPFWRRELDGLHGDTNAKAELIESRLPADAIMVARQESKAKVLAHGESPFHQKPITYPSLPSKADRAERLPSFVIGERARKALAAFDDVADAFRRYASTTDPIDRYFREWTRQASERSYFAELARSGDLLNAARGKSQTPDPVACAEVLERRYGILAKPLNVIEQPTTQETAAILATIVKRRATLPGAERPTIIPVFPDDMFKEIRFEGQTHTTLAEHVRKYHADLAART